MRFTIDLTNGDYFRRIIAEKEDDSSASLINPAGEVIVTFTGPDAHTADNDTLIGAMYKAVGILSGGECFIPQE